MSGDSVTAAQAARARYRAGAVEPTAGVAPGLVQANMIALPRDWAYDFLLYAQRNPKPCPVLDVTDPGAFTTVLADLSVPKYQRAKFTVPDARRHTYRFRE